VPKWDADFVNIEQETLFELILAANYMDIKSLLDLTCAKVASMIKGKTPEQIRQTFNIRKDFLRRRRSRSSMKISGARKFEVLPSMSAEGASLHPKVCLAKGLENVYAF